MLFTGAVLAAALAALSHAQGVFKPLRPPSIPLAVKSPYLTTWQQAGSDAGNGGYLPGQWPSFWFGAQTGWTGFIRVDNITYIWMGDPSVPDIENYYVSQTSFEYTSTRSTFLLDVAGVVGMNVSFLSPVLPNTILEMSLPYSYMDVTVYPIDGHEHEIQLYTDITAEWVAGDRDATAEWSYGTASGNPSPSSWAPSPTSTLTQTPTPATYGTEVSWSVVTSVSHGPSPKPAVGQGSHPAGVTAPPPNGVHTSSMPRPTHIDLEGSVAYHRVWRQTQLEFTESNQQAEWGYWYYATENVPQLTYQQGINTTVWSDFIYYGFLPNTQDNDFRPINTNMPVFGFALDLGTITTESKNALFQISLHQQNCILFEGADGNQSVPCMWNNYFDSEANAVEYFYNEYSSISSQSQALDYQVESDSVAAAGEDYYSITALAVRQAFGALEYTNTPEAPWVFLKELASGGDIQTVDVIFPFHPIAVYMNINILKWMLDPLFINQEAGFWPYGYSIHDLGTFPNATGHNDGIDEQQPLEECGNMMIMSLAYAQRTGNYDYLAEHYDLLHSWNNFLINDSLIPEDQLSTDDFLGAVVNDTNLAVKGIIGIEAMAQIANLTGHTEDGINFTQIAHSYIQQWQVLGINFNATPPHGETEYGNVSTWDLLYNIYGDAELGLGLVPQEIYKIQNDYYPTKFEEYGIRLRSSLPYGKVDWEMFCASIASDSTRDQFIGIIANWLDETTTNFAFPDFYNVETGGFAEDLFITRPVVGGVFSILALQSAPTNGTVVPRPIEIASKR